MKLGTTPNVLPRHQIAASNPQPGPTTQGLGPQDFEDDFTWSDLGKGLVGAVLVAGIEGVGNTASSLVKAPQALWHSYGALKEEKRIGPVLKTAIAVTLPVAAALTPPLTAVGSVLFGAYRGFIAAAEDGIGGAVKAGVDDVKFFHNDMAGELVKELAEYQSEPLEEGEEPFDISPVGGVKGLAAGATSAAITAVGAGGSIAIHTPRATWEAGKALWTSDASLPLKVGGTIMIAPAAVLAAPLGVIGGALYGLGKGAYDGYNEGFGTAVTNQFSDIRDLNKAIHEGLDELND